MKTKKKSTREKGTELEQEFKKYMEEKLEYEKCITNTKIKGKISTNEYEIDILGKKLSEQGVKMKNIGWILIIVAAIFLILNWSDIEGLSNDAFYLIVGGLLLGFILLQYGKSKEYEYTWVECKNYKNKIGKDTINTLNYKVKDYHESEDKNFEINNVFLVSAKGFIPNSLRFAEEYDIECYERKSKNKFKLIEIETII